MKYMGTPQGPLIAALAGGLLGLLGSQLLFLQGLTLVPWGVAATLVGFWSPSGRTAVLNGLLFGFALGLLFMVGGYTGTGPVTAVLPFFAVLGVFSAAAAAALASSMWLVRARLRGGA